jgi:hypothetical protein
VSVNIKNQHGYDVLTIQRENNMLQGDDRVIWGNLFKVLVVLVVVMLALILLANVLA